MTRCSLGNFLVVSTFATRCLHMCKAGRDPSAKNGTIWGEDCPLIFHKWQLSRHLSNCFRISEPLLFRTMYFVSVCSNLQTFSAMYALCSWLVPSHEIRLYANDMQRSYREYGTKTRIEPTEATGIYSLVFIPYMCWIWFRNIWLYKWSNTFNDVDTDVIDVCLETIHSISDEIDIITKNF